MILAEKNSWEKLRKFDEVLIVVALIFGHFKFRIWKYLKYVYSGD